MDSFKSLKEEAFEANREIPRRGLAIYTWGNVSAFDPGRGVFAIKPSGVAYDELSPAAMVLVDLEGRALEAGGLRPSSDTETHRVLYRRFAGIRGICHTHSPRATAWAQARRPLPVYGTTHADHAAGPIPCTAIMDEEAVKNDYELETGNLIAAVFEKDRIDPLHTPMVLAAGHGPFTWGKSAAQALYHAAVLEEICGMAQLTLALDPAAPPLPEYIIRKHWERKHGPAAYYGQG